MDIDKLMMFLIMYNMCNDSKTQTKQEVTDVSQHNKKKVGNHMKSRNKAQHNGIPRAPKSQALKAFKRKL